MPANFYKYRFVLTGGGTGGHIMPLIAMNNYLQEYPVEIIYIGEKGGREEKIASENGIKFVGIMAGKWRRYFDFNACLDNIVDIFKLVTGTFQALYILIKFRPNAILSKGGYVSLPVIVAGWVARIPILVHESDIEMGLTNKLASNFVTHVATGFPTENYPQNEKIEMTYTGIPIDRDFFDNNITSADYEFFGFDKKIPILLVTGGIQGAHKINELVKENLSKLVKDWQIVHLCGEADYPELKEKWEKLQSKRSHYAVFPFLGKERIMAMRIANLVVSRASATTLAELASMAKPLILIPLPEAASDHQRKNAAVFEKAGAAIVLDENNLTTEELYGTIDSLKDDTARLRGMAKAVAEFAKPEAGKMLVERLIQIIHE